MYDICKSCGRTIKWSRTRAGKRMPLDPEPSSGGNVVLVDGVAVSLDSAAVAALDPATPRWMPHWATCSESEKHRRPKESHDVGPR